MNLAPLTLGGQRIIIFEPNGLQYGHLGLEIAMGLAHARDTNAEAYLLIPKRVVSPAILELETDDVRVVRPDGALGAAARAYLAVHRQAEELQRTITFGRGTAAEELRKEIGRHIEDARLPVRLRDRLRQISEAFRQQVLLAYQAKQTARPYYRRRLLRVPLRTRLRREAADRAAETARAHGIDANAKIVTLHIREPGFKRGREVQDKGNVRDDSVRNAHVENHFDAIDELAAHGYTIVRIGDPSMTPIVRRGVVDLATAPDWNDLVQVYCLWRSQLIICGESGPLMLAYLTDTPILTVNATDPISSYPVRPSGIYLLKHVIDRASGKEFRVSELLTEQYLRKLRDRRYFCYVDNTGPEIAEAVRETMDLLAGRRPETDSQRAYRAAVTDTSTACRGRLGYVRKWGADEGFIGDGRLARFVADRDL